MRSYDDGDVNGLSAVAKWDRPQLNSYIRPGIEI